MLTAFGSLHFSTKIMLSSPILRSSTRPAEPRSSLLSSSMLVLTRAPVDFVDLTADDANSDDSDLAEELQRALENVREEYCTCFVLFYQQELSIAEIAEILGCPQGTVKTWLHRARRELAEQLKRRGYGPEAHYELHGI